MSKLNQQLQVLAAEYGTPLYVYDEKGIRETAQFLSAAFADITGYRNYLLLRLRQLLRY